MSQNSALIGCSDKTGQDQHLKMIPRNHIFFTKSFLTQGT